MNNLQIEFTKSPREKDVQALTNGIASYAKEMRGLTPVEPFGFFSKDPHGVILAGCNGIIFYGSMFIDQLWVDKKLRHQGIGTQLMQKAEQFAKDSSCTMITVHTMDWEALDFYKRFGFKIDLERAGYANNSKMFFLRKML